MPEVPTRLRFSVVVGGRPLFTPSLRVALAWAVPTCIVVLPAKLFAGFDSVNVAVWLV